MDQNGKCRGEKGIGGVCFHRREHLTLWALNGSEGGEALEFQSSSVLETLLKGKREGGEGDKERTLKGEEEEEKETRRRTLLEEKEEKEKEVRWRTFKEEEEKGKNQGGELKGK
jgi:hypothetical protein